MLVEYILHTLNSKKYALTGAFLITEESLHKIKLMNHFRATKKGYRRPELPKGLVFCCWTSPKGFKGPPVIISGGEEE